MSLRTTASSVARALRLAALVAPLALAACGGTSDGTPADATPPPAVAGPTAAFSAAATTTAMQAVAFDAGSSVSVDGSALSFRWDFGDGHYGGGRTLAHVFADAGTPTVTLTVVDGAGRVATATRTVTVAAPAAATATATVHAVVSDLAGAAVAGAVVSRIGAATTATTDANGLADLVVGVGPTLVFSVKKSGYSDQFVTLALPAAAGNDGRLEATLRPRDAAVTLADAHAGGTVTGRGGATLTLPADALVDAGGARVTGAVDVAMTPVDVTAPRGGGFPGRFDGVRADASTTPIASLGTVEFVLSAGGRPVQLAAGKTATIEIPISASVKLDGTSVAAGGSVDLWSLDEASANWIQESTGDVVASSASPTGLSLRARVAHLSWWNADLGFDPYGPKPRCVYDDDIGIPEAADTFNNATMCNFLAEFDRSANTVDRAGRATAARASAQAASAPARILGYSRTGVVQIAGGQYVPVPANWNIALSMSALNGTWTGRVLVNGAVGVQDDVIVKMRPLPGTSFGVESIALPFDTTRQIAPSQIARYSFTGAPDAFVQVTVSGVTGSVVSGHVRVLQGATLIATRDFTSPSTSTFTAAVGTTGPYRIEVESTATAAAGYHLHAEIVGGTQVETVALPFDVQRTLPALTTYRGGFDGSAGSAVSLALRQVNTNLALTTQLIAPDGSVVSSIASTGSSSSPQVVTLPTTGRYTLVAAQAAGTATTFRATGETVAWLSTGPGLDVSSGYSILDLKADRTGAPVVGYVITSVGSSSTPVSTLRLRRWNGSVWEAVGSDITLPFPCGGSSRSADFAFDAQNRPYLVYGSRVDNTSSASYTAVRRFVDGAWQGAGSDSGRIEVASNQYDSACQTVPRVALDAADRAVVAYRNDAAVRVVRFDGTAWADLVPSTSFPVVYATYDLALDSAGTPYFLLSQDGVARVRRFDGTAWQPVGAGGGTLPQTDTSDVGAARLRFDAGGLPVVGALVAVGSSVTTTGVATWRYDGTAWNSPLGYILPGSYINNTLEPGVAVAADNSVLMSWNNQSSAIGGTTVVQRVSTAGAWSPVGGDLGQIRQFWPHALTPDATPLDSRLLVTTQGDWMAIVVNASPGSSQGQAFRVQLLKRVAP